MERPLGTISARVISVIETKAIKGLGTKEDPAREVTQYWDLEGKYLAGFDPEHVLPMMEYEYNAVKNSATQDL